MKGIKAYNQIRTREAIHSGELREIAVLLLDICYLETSSSHKDWLRVHSSEGESFYRSSLIDFCEKHFCERSRFIKTNGNLAINLGMIQDINPVTKKITLKNDEPIKIKPHSWSDFIKNYSKYFQ